MNHNISTAADIVGNRSCLIWQGIGIVSLWESGNQKGAIASCRLNLDSTARVLQLLRASFESRNLHIQVWRGGWVDESGGLENRWGATSRGFESLPLRHWLQTKFHMPWSSPPTEPFPTNFKLLYSKTRPYIAVFCAKFLTLWSPAPWC